MKLYYSIMLFVIALFVWFGFVGPYCISAANDLLVWGYIGVTVAVIPFVVKFVINIIRKILKLCD